MKWLGDSQSDLELRVVNLSGQIVHRSALPVTNGNAVADLDLRSLAGGVYIVEMTDGIRVHHKRLVLQQ